MPGVFLAVSIGGTSVVLKYDWPKVLGRRVLSTRVRVSRFFCIRYAHMIRGCVSLFLSGYEPNGKGFVSQVRECCYPIIRLVAMIHLSVFAYKKTISLDGNKAGTNDWQKWPFSQMSHRVNSTAVLQNK